MTPEELAAQIATLPKLAKKPPKTSVEHHKDAFARAAKAGGKATTIILTPAANRAMRWALTTPGFPVTQNKVMAAALAMYEAHHRGGPCSTRILDPQTIITLERMLAERPEVTEGELIGLAVRHLAWSFRNSPDGSVDT